MTSALEWNKLKRTGFFPAFLAGGLLAAAAPVVNIGARPESFVNKQDSPAVILMGANWQLMSMLLSFLLIIGACIMYHTEFADNAMQRMDTLPKRPESLFFGKCSVLLVLTAGALVLGGAALWFCGWKWFSADRIFTTEIWKSMGFSFAMFLPLLLCMTAVSSICKNMWISLGIGTICLFMTSILQNGGGILSYLPFMMPMKVYPNLNGAQAVRCLIISCGETAGFGLLEIIYFKIRMHFT